MSQIKSKITLKQEDTFSKITETNLQVKYEHFIDNLSYYSSHCKTYNNIMFSNRF